MVRRPLNALLIEDNEDDAVLIVRELGAQGFEVTWDRVQTGPAMKDALQQRDWAVVLSDYQMPKFDAPAALRVLQDSGQDLPFLVISGTIGEDIAVETMKAGAHDYLLKGNLTRLGQAIEREMRETRIRRERQSGIEKIKHLNRVLRAIRGVNRLIVQQKNPARLIEECCECLVETRGYDAAWFALLNDQHEATAVAGRGYSHAWEDVAESLGRGKLPFCATEALSSSNLVLVAEQVDACQNCVILQQMGSHKTLAVRIEHQERVYGVMAVTLLGDVPIDESESSLLEEVAGDIGFALWSIETDHARRAEEKKFRVTFDNANIGKVLCAPDGRLLRVNHAFCDLLGYSRAELETMEFMSITHPVDHAISDEAVRSLMAGERTSFRLEKRYLHKDGRSVWADVSIILLHKQDGSPDTFVLHVLDISERKKLVEELKSSEEKFRQVFDGAQAIVLVLDPAGRIVLFNPYLEQLSGHKLENTRGKDWIKTFLPDHSHPGAREQLRRAMEGDSTRGKIDFLLTRDGQELLIEWNDRPLNDSEGNVTGLLCMGQDVTVRQQADELLRDSQEYLANIINTIGDPIFVKDEHFSFTLVNTALCTLLGKTQQELIGTTGGEILPPEEMKHFLSVDREVLSTGIENISKESLTAADGETLSIVTKKTRYIDRHEAKHIVGVIRDMTNFNQMQSQIAQSDRLASMGMLAAGVAHEINNPLCYILYNLKSLTDDLPRLSAALRQCLDFVVQRLSAEEWAEAMGTHLDLLNPAMLDDIRVRFKDALEGTQRIKEIARGLGTFSRVDQDELVPVNLRNTIEVAINLVFNEIKYRSKLVKEYGKISSIMANDGKLSQVFLNLLVNAAHSIADGDVESNEIRVRTWQEGDQVFAEVRDTGKGIADEHLSHLFDPFFTTKEIGVGTGLGLSISKSIVEDYGGSIDVKSEVGEGTSFVVRLPVRMAKHSDEASVSEHTAIQLDVRGRILLIDDEAGIRSAMTRMLRGHDVVEAASGDEARKILEADRTFDLVLCDMMMPRMSGVELHEWLSNTDPDLARQVVFITGGAFTPRAREYLTKVSNIRLEKPFDVANFKKIVGELIISHRAKES